jgi:hypothetical protein
MLRARLHEAAKQSNNALLRNLLHDNQKLIRQIVPRSLLFPLIREDNVAGIKLCIEYGIDINRPDVFAPLTKAIFMRSNGVIDLLLEQKLTYDTVRDAIVYCIRNDNQDMIMYLQRLIEYYETNDIQTDKTHDNQIKMGNVIFFVLNEMIRINTDTNKFKIFVNRIHELSKKDIERLIYNASYYDNPEKLDMLMNFHKLDQETFDDLFRWTCRVIAPKSVRYLIQQGANIYSPGLLWRVHDKQTFLAIVNTDPKHDWKEPWMKLDKHDSDGWIQWILSTMDKLQ